jgi:hypothetical protein
VFLPEAGMLARAKRMRAVIGCFMCYLARCFPRSAGLERQVAIAS